MKEVLSLRRTILVLLLTLATGSAATIQVFQTGFESSEGYNGAFDLDGQLGWIGSIPYEGDTGLFDGEFAGQGQQAYIGLDGEGAGEEAVFVWRPLDQIPPEFQLIQFSVTMAVDDSTTNAPTRDYFDWSVFNFEGEHLFSIEFDNDDLGIYYTLENGTNFLWTGSVFQPFDIYELVIEMDRFRNLWSAKLDGMFIVLDQPITEFGSSLDISDVDAAWIYRDPANPGDNLMLFDNYTITASSIPQPSLTNVTRLPNGDLLLRVVGEVGESYAVEATTDFVEWFPLGTNTANGGFFDFVDDEASEFNTSFYRAVLVP